MSIRTSGHVLTEAAAAMGVRSLQPIGEPLRGSDRAVVQRVAVDPGPGTAVVKVFASERAGEGWVREAAALSLLRGTGARALRLLAVGAEPPFVVSADLGAGPNLADALLGSDPAVATETLGGWADAVASVHRSTLGGAVAYAGQLARFGGDLPADVDTTPALVRDCAGQLAELLPGLGVSPTARALAELRQVTELLAGGAHALSPGDTCPDNNVRTADGLVLVDFEAATVRHVAWDAAYLSVPWPSCWCCWALPEGVAAAALERWRAGVRAVFPEVDTAAFGGQLETAAAAWAFVSTGWFLARAMGEDPPPADPRLAGLVPSRRAMIQHRLGGALSRGCPALPGLADLAEQVLDATVRRWGYVPLALAPAYR